MAGIPWVYFVPYQPDFERALDQLRRREFEAGRYHPLMSVLPSIIDEATTGPGKQHETVSDAFIAAMGEGTKSILDIDGLDDMLCLGRAYRLRGDEIEELFGTSQPTREMVCRGLAMLDLVDRGEAVCFAVYDEHGSPMQICFAGYSLD